MHSCSKSSAIAAKKSLEYGYDGFMYGFAANEKLMKHYVDKLNAEEIGILHPYQFAIDEENAKQIPERSDTLEDYRKEKFYHDLCCDCNNLIDILRFELWR